MAKAKWVCKVCGYEYDGDVPFEELEDEKENDECCNNNVAHYDLALALSRIIQSYISSHISYPFKGNRAPT